MHAHSVEPGRVTVRASGRPARRPCVLYSETGSNTQAPTKLHGPVCLPQQRPDSTVLVWLKHTSAYSPAPGLDLTGTLRYAAGTNTFGGDITSANGMSGRADGRFYGPGAEEVGGVFETRGAGTEVYGGAFGGRR